MHINMKGVLNQTTLLVLLLISSKGIAQSARGRDGLPLLNLSQCLDSAVVKYPSIKAKLNKKMGTEKEVNVAKNQYVPSLTLQEQMVYASANSMQGTFWPNEGYAFPTAGAVRDQQNWNGAFGQYTTLSLNGPITSFGKIKLSVQASKEKALAADYEYQNEVFVHKVKVVEAYLSLLVYRSIVKVQHQNLERATVLHDVIRSKVINGLRPGVDSSFVNAELSKAKLRLLAAERQERAAYIKLAEYMGVEANTFDIDPMDFDQDLPTSEEFTSVIDNHPTLKMYHSMWDAQQKSAKAIHRQWAPTFKYMVAGIGRGSGISSSDTYTNSLASGIRFQRYNYLVGVHMLWNIFDFTKTRNEYKSARFEADQLRYEYEEQELKLNRNLENAQLQLNLSKEQAHEAPVQLEAAQSAYKQASSRYESGLATLPELSGNLLLLSRAEADLAIAYNNVWQSLLSKAAASGDLDQFIQQTK